MQYVLAKYGVIVYVLHFFLFIYEEKLDVQFCK